MIKTGFFSQSGFEKAETFKTETARPANRLVKNILVAVNGSESSAHAAMYGVILAKTYRFNLKFAYVVDTATLKRLTLANFLIEEENSDFLKSLKDDGQKYLNFALNLAKQKNVRAEAELLEGSVWGELISAADKFKAQLVLLGGGGIKTSTHISKSNSTETFSITEKEIILHARCSVMVVREPNIEQLFCMA